MTKNTEGIFRHTAKHRIHLEGADPVLKEAIANIKLKPRVLRTGYFHALARSIIGQQLSVGAAASIFTKVQKLFRTTSFPTPATFLAMPEQELRQAGLSQAKVGYIRNVAEFILAHPKEFKKLETLSDEEIIALLTQIKGIGRWTAEMFLIFCLGRDDVYSHGDLGLRTALKNIYKLRKLPSPQRAKKITDKWKPYRSHGSLYLWASLDND
jgi:DNA-3-methyladenine glycosylase II